MPQWLVFMSWVCLIVAITCAALIVIDILMGHRQHMAIMNLVWPITALYFGPLALWGYHRFGRKATHEKMMHAKAHGEQNPAREKPVPVVYALATTHCGSGCALGDLIAEWGVHFLPVLLVWFGYQTLWDEKIFSTWIIDFILAFLLGIIFQYFTIAPMRNLSLGEGIKAALKADTLSLTAWQVGMYGWMAIATFLIFGEEIPKTSPVFWMMMQIAMIAGFLTSYPVNVWLVKSGVKEKM